MLRLWTINRATGIGIVAGVATLALGPLREAEAWAWAYSAAAMVTAFCGASILVITVVDMLSHHRGTRMRAIRVFDVAMGLLLTLPALDALLG